MVQELEVDCHQVQVLIDGTVIDGLSCVALALLDVQLYDWLLLPEGTAAHLQLGQTGRRFHACRQQPPLTLTLQHATADAQLQPVVAGCPPVRNSSPFAAPGSSLQVMMNLMRFDAQW